ncbi:vitamin D3 receptor B-like [Saccoglossus kowalevskii]|uniref:Bile acid receptor-like n=1 Tax=Saccoglossus kowalevskii TaxID=10224 RepID=A0ABM0H1Q3_SACKO|nr:PREDICTED: bile acid receptor-like [Saccoglossus kowalevskii]
MSTDKPDKKMKMYKCCVVCGDHANGLHYKVMSCEGCKTFFRRNVQHREKLKCEMDTGGACEMDLFTRRQCPACRMRKCLDSGMQINRVWTTERLATRKPIVKKKPKATTCTRSPTAIPEISQSMPSPLSSESDTSSSLADISSTVLPTFEFTNDQRCQIDYLVSSLTKAQGSVSTPQAPKSIPKLKKESTNSTVQSTQACSTTNDASAEHPKQLTSEFTKEKVKGINYRSKVSEEAAESEYGKINTEDEDLVKNKEMFEHFMEMLVMVLKQLIAFAKYLHGFRDLSYQDQAKLIKSSLLECMMIGASECYCPEEGGFFNEGNAQLYGRDLHREAGFENILSEMEIFSKSMLELNLNHEEYTLLLAIIILTPDREDLLEQKKVEMLQQSLIELLQACIRKYHNNNHVLFAKIIGKLTQLRDFSEQYTSHIMNLNVKGHKLNPLLSELFESNS